MINKKHETSREWWKSMGMYTIAFAVVAALILGIYLSQGKTFMRMVDGVGQHYAVLRYVRKYIREFFSTGALPMIDFSVGQGFDVIGTLNYYGFGDPLTLLTALFPENALETMYGFFIFLRLYLSGVAFLGFCFTIGKREKALALSGSLLYVFCNFALYSGVTHPCFLNGVMYLPLLLIGIERLIQKKGLLALALTVAASFMSNYYFMYMNTILAGVYLLIRLAGQYRSLGLKGFFKIVGRIILAYVWGVCLAGVILLPAVYAFLQNGRGDLGLREIRLIYDKKYYLRIWQGMTGPVTSGANWSMPGTGAVGVVSMMILLVRRPKKEGRLLLGAVVLGIMLCLPVIGSVMNGFSYVSNRWSYGMAFLLALSSVFALSHLRDLTKKETLLVFGLSVLYCVPLAVIWKLLTHDKEAAINAAVVLFTATALLGAAWAFRGKRREVLLWSSVGITMVGVLWNVENLYGKSFLNYPKGYLQQGVPTAKLDNSPYDALALATEDSFYRTERYWDILNQALVEGVNGTGFYYSVVPGSMCDLYKSVWLSAQERTYVLNSLDSRTALTALASVKYYVNDEETSIPFGYEKAGEVSGTGKKVYELFENQNALPLGYTYDTVMSRADYDKLGPLEREQTLLSSAVIEEPGGKVEQTTQAAACSIVSREITVKDSHKVKFRNGKITVKKGGTLTLAFEGEPNSETYLVLSGIGAKDSKRDLIEVSSSGAKTRLKVTGDKQHNYFGKEGEALNLGYQEEAQTECTLYFKEARTFYLDDVSIQCVGMDYLEEQISERKEESLEDIQVSTNRITGKITTTGTKVLQLSLPYSKGWKIYVDGEKTETFPSSIAYTGLYLEEGEHEIVAVYTSPWIIPGGILTGSSLAWTVIYLVLRRKKGGGSHEAVLLRNSLL